MAAKHLQTMLQHAETAFPHEACGVILKVGKKTKVVRCRNISPTPETCFQIHPDDYTNAEDAGEIVGIYHSHPNTSAEPSPADLSMCEATGVPWHIVSWPQAGYRYFEPSGYKAPLIGRPFVYGVHDCGSLVEDYYESVGIVVPKFSHGDNGWWNAGQNLYMDSVQAAGFRRVDQLQQHDLILMQFEGTVPHHAAIFIGDDTILQHLDGRLSGRTFYGEYYRKVTHSYWRPGSLC